ncbi:MAG: TetR/AcrR family transcriptional regulator [Acidobacteriota bacterium]|nr:TetR/AcrR family transcriptional regulator [Blastocatellia bacterium]MDW8238268.1 TetR/AcrR family transcriptional regulator [Acidobacteriota bacterium]
MKKRPLVKTSVKDEALVKKRRYQIYKAALRAFTKNGFHETNLRQVTQLAGLAYGSIYDYVESKNDILFLIYDSVLDELRTRLEAAARSTDEPIEQIKAMIKAAMDHTDEYQDAIVLLYQESRVMKDSGFLAEVFEKERGYIRLFADVLERGVQCGVFRVPNIRVIENLLPIMCSAWALKRWNLKGVTKESYGEALVQFVLRGIGVLPGVDGREQKKTRRAALRGARNGKGKTSRRQVPTTSLSL